MAYDFKLTEQGDIIFEKPVETGRFKLRFGMAENTMASVKFLSRQEKQKEDDANFRISFKTQLEEESAETATGLTGEAADTQRVLIALRTQIKEIERRPEIGSALTELTYDRPITSAKLAAIESAVKEVVSKVWSDATVTAVRETGAGNMPYQNITVYVRNATGDTVLTYVI